MKLIKENLDERELLETLKSRRIGFWILNVLLITSIIVQSWILNLSFAHYAAEFIAFIIADVYIIISDVRRGAWEDFTHSKPGIKSYLLWSVMGSVLFSVFYMLVNFWQLHNLGKDVPASKVFISTGIFCIFLFCLCYITLAIVGTMTKKRQDKLKEKYTEEEDE